MTYMISQNSTITSTLPALAAMNYDITAVLDEVSEAFGVPAALITSKCQRHIVKTARWIYWLALLQKGYTQAECGRMTGGHHPSSVSHALSQIDHDIKNDPITIQGYEKLRHLFINNKAKNETDTDTNERPGCSHTGTA